jgi:hypothetical protein
MSPLEEKMLNAKVILVQNVCMVIIIIDSGKREKPKIKKDLHYGKMNKFTFRVAFKCKI